MILCKYTVHIYIYIIDIILHVSNKQGGINPTMICIDTNIYAVHHVYMS